MRTRIIRIDGADAVQIPADMLRRAGLTDVVEIEVQGHEIVIRRADASPDPRAGWAEAFAEIRAREGVSTVDDDLSDASAWDDREWEW